MKFLKKLLSFHKAMPIKTDCLSIQGHTQTQYWLARATLWYSGWPPQHSRDIPWDKFTADMWLYLVDENPDALIKCDFKKFPPVVAVKYALRGFMNLHVIKPVFMKLSGEQWALLLKKYGAGMVGFVPIGWKTINRKQWRAILKSQPNLWGYCPHKDFRIRTVKETLQ